MQTSNGKEADLLQPGALQGTRLLEPISDSQVPERDEDGPDHGPQAAPMDMVDQLVSEYVENGDRRAGLDGRFHSRVALESGGVRRGPTPSKDTSEMNKIQTSSPRKPAGAVIGLYLVSIVFAITVAPTIFWLSKTVVLCRDVEFNSTAIETIDHSREVVVTARGSDVRKVVHVGRFKPEPGNTVEIFTNSSGYSIAVPRVAWLYALVGISGVIVPIAFARLRGVDLGPTVGEAHQKIKDIFGNK